MKKILITIIALCLSYSKIYADEYNQQGTYSIALSCTNSPSYSVKIPKSLDVSNNETVLNYFVKGDIYGDQILKVIFDSETTLTSHAKQETISVVQNKNTWECDELSNSYNQYEITLSHNQLSAGQWNGTLNVVISLQEGEN